MPIFTFMGASVLRQDDEYSGHVIEQTIKSVIPTLASTTSACEAKVETTPIIAAFLVNFDFIPKHRRLSYFFCLELLSLDYSKYYWRHWGRNNIFPGHSSS
jgi:U3 small nucleolar RNA-associated protein 10